MFYLLTTLITTGLIVWAIDSFSGDDDGPKEETVEKKFDPDTNRMVVTLTNGNDTYTGTNQNEQIFGRKGNDFVASGDGNDAINLYKGNDVAAAGAGNDRIFGGEGSDLMNGGAGKDFVSGGAGDDLVFSKDSIAVLSEIAGKDVTSEMVRSGSNLDKLIARADVSDAGDDYIRGDGGNDVLFDNVGKNLIEGGPGNDRINTYDLKGTDTPDTVYGGAGDDTIQADDGDQVWGGLGKDKFKISVMEVNDKPVAIKDFERGETLQIQIDTPTNAAPTLTYQVNNGVMTIQNGSHLLATLQAKNTAFTNADIPVIQAATTVTAT